MNIGVNLSSEVPSNVVCDHSRNSNSTDAMPHLSRLSQPPFTEDSSVSSTYSPHTRSLSLSLASANRTRSSLKTSKSVILRRQRIWIGGDQIQRKTIDEVNDFTVEGEKNIYSSQASNSSANEEVVKVTNASTLDLACIVQSEPPQIKDYPQVIRADNNAKNCFDRTAFVMQLHCDQQKLMNSSLIRKHNNEINITNIQTQPKIVCSIIKRFISKEVQTLPVLIFPISNEDDVTPSHKCDQKEKINETNLKSIDKSQVVVIDQETQAPTIQKQRIRTHSDITGQTKDGDNTDIQIDVSLKTLNGEEENKVSEEFWGDVYNDYKKQMIENSTKLNLSKQSNKKVVPRLNIKSKNLQILPYYTGGDVRKKSLSAPKKRSNYISNLRTELKSQVLGNKIQSIPNMKGEEEYEIADIENFQRFYEVPQFDEMAKSYLTLSDRRVRSICSKIGCKIRMYGPIVRWNSDDTSTQQIPSRVKTFYYITVGALTKERLDKSIKCIQETFPKACLCQKYNVLPLSENLGKEIPI